MSPPLVLASHVLCPYVQRAAIVLAEKGVSFERRDIDLANKPDWFMKVSPLGKTPVLLVGDEAIFESAVICEYLEETALPRLHPVNALQRAQHRSWMEFGSAFLNLIGAFYNAAAEPALLARAAEIRARLAQMEMALGEGPYFAGESFSIVDAVFGPAFRYFDVFDAIGEFGFWDGLPKVQQWRRALATRASVAGAVRLGYPDLLRRFLLARGSALTQLMTSGDAPAWPAARQADEGHRLPVVSSGP
ncbi:glutathione S-transferase family protein [Piscinibacter sp.]|uniref:glutathione S-transferase family protein n=1 Tax=Piscinibacter sp. TaxID=1903157 RepID=UPI002C5FD51F|nr:glutathione S-transferase family protein [Albitalea sp.]HUG26270.1 glutathione S-transferase family protein [Albitalea sp.]